MNKKSEKKQVDKNVSQEQSPTRERTRTFEYNDINFKQIDLSDPTEVGKQHLIYVNYKEPDSDKKFKIYVKSGKIKLTSHGIPRLDEPDVKDGYYPNDAKREFIKIPLDKSQPDCNNLRSHLEKIDKWLGSKEMCKQLFGADAKDYKYQPCIRTPKPPPGKKKRVDAKGNEYPIIDYAKFKFQVMPDANGNRPIVTKIKKLEGNKKVLMTNIKSVTDIAQVIRYNTEIRFIFDYTKIWISSKYEYGLGLRIMVIEYTPNAMASSASNPDFDSDEEEITDANVKSDSKKDAKVKSETKVKLDDDDDDNNDDNDNKNDNKNDDDDDSSEKEISVKKNKKESSKESPKKEAAKKESPKKESSKKNAKNSDDDDDDDDDDDEDIKVKKNKKETKKDTSKKEIPKKSTKKSKNDDDDDDNDEDENDDDEEIQVKKSKKPKAKSGKR